MIGPVVSSDLITSKNGPRNSLGVNSSNPAMKMKCCLFNDPFDNYGHIGSGNGSGELRSGVGWE